LIDDNLENHVAYVTFCRLVFVAIKYTTTRTPLRRCRNCTEPNFRFSCRCSVFFSTRNTDVDNLVSVLFVKYRLSNQFLCYI